MNHIPQLLNRASRRFQLGVPREAKLDPYGTWAVLEDHIGTPPFDAELWDRIRRLAARVTGKRGRWGPWSVDVGAQRAERGTVEVDPSGYGYHRIRVICGQCADTGDACPHILAFTLAAGYAHEGTRARMQTPGWQRFLGALRGPPEAAGRSARSDAPRPGWLRVVLHRHGDGEVLLGRLASVWYVRRAARGGRWMRALAELGLSGVLADDMGLGKTVQTLATLLDAHRASGAPEAAGPSLVVAPTSVIHNWVQEAARFTPDLRVALHYGPQRGAPPTDADVVVTSYALLRIDAEQLHAVEWRYAVLDEAQHIKNPASKVARAARGLRAAHRLALSGTPLENHLAELWSLFEFLMPGFFGSRRAFRTRYVEPITQTEDEERRVEALDRLRRRIRPFVLRRLKREVATELPPRQEQVLSCELGGAERRLYDAVRETYRESVLGEVDAVGIQRATIRILEALTRLRQAACDPSLLPFPEARGFTDSAKRARLREVLAELIVEGHRALVFSQWPSLLKRVRFDLDRMGLDHLYLDGGTRERGDLQARWNAPDGPPVFLISLKAGGTGLNLVGADVVIHLDPWWNPQAEQQATDRAHRIGQTKPVMVYKLVARDTVEEKIVELQARKRALFEAAVDGDRVTVDALSRADLEAVFGEG